METPERLEMQLGEISKKFDKAKGNQYKKVECPSGGHSKTATLSSFGVSRQKAHEAERLAEIDENLVRNELHYTERGDLLL
jgi:hypothetical protein